MMYNLKNYWNRKTRLEKKINEKPELDNLNKIYKEIYKINIYFEKEKYKTFIKREKTYCKNLLNLNKYLKENKIKNYWSTLLINSKLFPKDNNEYLNFIKYINLKYIDDENNLLKNKIFEFHFKKNDIFSNKLVKLNLYFEKEEINSIKSDKINFINDNKDEEIIYEEIPFKKNTNTKYYKKNIKHILFFNIFKNRELDYINSENISDDDFNYKKNFENKDLSFEDLNNFLYKLEDILCRNYLYYKNYKKIKIEKLNKLMTKIKDKNKNDDLNKFNINDKDEKLNENCVLQ